MAIAPASGPVVAEGFSNPLTTATFTAPAGSILVAFVVDTSYSGKIFTLSNTGTPLSWVLARRSGDIAIYRAYNATSQSITVTFSTSGSSSDYLICKVVPFTGVDSTSPIGEGNSGSSSANFVEPWLLTTSANNSRVVYIANDRNGLGLPTVGPDDTGFRWSFTSVPGSASSGFAAYKTANTSSSGTAAYGYLDAGGSAAANWTWVAVELRASTTQTITPTGISSGEAHGTAQVNLTVSPSGIASGEALGTPDIALQNLIIAEGIESGESFGSIRLVYDQFIGPTSVASEEAFGTPGIQLGYPQTVETMGIPSEEVVTDGPLVKMGHRIIFQPPAVQEQPMARNVLHVRFGIHRGITVIKRHDGSFYETRYPDQVTVEESAKVYWGGHVNEVSTEDYLALVQAGYGSYLSLEAV